MLQHTALLLLMAFLYLNIPTRNRFRVGISVSRYLAVVNVVFAGVCELLVLDRSLNTNMLVMTVANVIPGSYEFKLEVTSPAGFTESSTAKIEVNSPPSKGVLTVIKESESDSSAASNSVSDVAHNATDGTLFVTGYPTWVSIPSLTVFYMF